MTEIRALGGLSRGEEIYVFDICGDTELCEKLRGIGINVGTKIKCVLISPFGDPKAYDICGSVIVLRRADADCILGAAPEQAL
ncbi:MAG: ferrous iron transport protein A [Clostridia bacterium]|nr:ferrous iron transport protein A [Clostridia bacterium]MBQ8850781.1 ferrous iron transport protein A [Clostridia bacterium]